MSQYQELYSYKRGSFELKSVVAQKCVVLTTSDYTCSNVLTILDSIVNIIGRGGEREQYDHSMSTNYFTSIMNKNFIRDPKRIGGKWVRPLTWFC